MEKVSNDKAIENEAQINTNDDTTLNHKQKIIPDAPPEAERPVVNTAAIVSEPNFDALATLDNNFSENAAPPPLPEGAESSSPAVRGRPSLSAEERASRKKQRDAEYRAKKTGKPAPAAQAVKQAPAANTPPTAEAVATAEMVVASLDMILQTASGGEFEPVAAARTGMVSAWSKYLHQTGKELPAWAEVTIMSAVYMLPIMRSPTLKERCAYAFMRAKTFIQNGF